MRPFFRLSSPAAGLAAVLLSACTHAVGDAPRAAIVDTEPDVTRQVAEVLGHITDGALPHALMTEKADAALAAQAPAMAMQLRACPRPFALALLDRRTKGEDRQYTYRVACGARALLLDVDYNKAARINKLVLHGLESPS